MVTSGSLGAFFVVLVLLLAYWRSLLPGVVLTGSFIMFVLFLAGLIETSIQLFTQTGNIQSNCANYITNDEQKGNSLATLSWITQNTICEFFLSLFLRPICTTGLLTTIPFHARSRQLLENNICI